MLIGITVFLMIGAFGVVYVQHATYGDDVVDADHVTHCAADGLQGEDEGNGQAGIKRDLLLNRTKGQVGYSVGAGEECTDCAQVWGEVYPVFASHIGKFFTDDFHHGVVARQPSSVEP